MKLAISMRLQDCAQRQCAPSLINSAGTVWYWVPIQARLYSCLLRAIASLPDSEGSVLVQGLTTLLRPLFPAVVLTAPSSTRTLRPQPSNISVVSLDLDDLGTHEPWPPTSPPALAAPPTLVSPTLTACIDNKESHHS